MVTPNVEAVGQITVITSAYSAEYGRNSGARAWPSTASGAGRARARAIPCVPLLESTSVNETGAVGVFMYGPFVSDERFI